MKLKVLREFIDKHTHEKYVVGWVKDFEQSRAEELLADRRNLVEKYIEKKPAGRAKKPKK